MSGRDFARFERACWKWIGALGLRDWRIDVVQERLSIGTRQAEVSINRADRNARLAWNTHLGGERLALLSPDELALHEVLHIALCDTVELAADAGWCMRADVQQAEHALIARLVGVMGKR